MTRRNRESPSKQKDPAARYRAKLEARRAAAHEAQAGRWFPGVRDRLTLAFARLLYTATAPTTKSRGLRKRFLERWFFRAVTQHAAHRKTLYKVSKAVLSATKARNPVTFRQSRDELRRLWNKTRADR